MDKRKNWRYVLDKKKKKNSSGVVALMQGTLSIFSLICRWIVTSIISRNQHCLCILSQSILMYCITFSKVITLSALSCIYSYFGQVS